MSDLKNTYKTMKEQYGVDPKEGLTPNSSKGHDKKLVSETVSEKFTIRKSKYLKHIKKFESFENEGNNILKEIEKLFEDYSIYEETLIELELYDSERDIENAIEWGELTFGSLMERIKWFLEDKFNDYDVAVSGYYQNVEKMNIKLINKKEKDEVIDFELTTSLFD